MKPLPSSLTRRRKACLLVRSSRTAARDPGRGEIRRRRRRSKREMRLGSLLLSAAGARLPTLAARYRRSSAWARSAHRSSTCSIPTDSPHQAFRYREQLAGSSAGVARAWTRRRRGWSQSTQRAQASTNASAVFASARSIEINEPKPDIVRRASARDNGLPGVLGIAPGARSDASPIVQRERGHLPVPAQV